MMLGVVVQKRSKFHLQQNLQPKSRIPVGEVMVEKRLRPRECYIMKKFMSEMFLNVKQYTHNF